MANSQLISVHDLHDVLTRGEIRVIDCRFDLARPAAGREAWLESHIPGAAYAHLDDDLAGAVTPESGRHPLPEPATLAATFGAMGVGQGAPVVVYDAGNGAMAARAWWLLRWLGHDAVQLLDGGFAAWRAAGLPTATGEELIHGETFVANPRYERVITTEELLQTDNIADLNLLDARDAARFSGLQEPIDPVAGHIPGARNLPLTESLDRDGYFAEQDVLEALWDEVLGPDRTSPWAVMCGSGVTACHIALSGVEAGRAEPRIYVGSWSEWIRDPNRAVATGDG